jgi:hypothetical protein
MKLIDKSALAAEIKRLIDRSEYSEVYDYAFRDGNNAVCVHILHFLNTLETKEVDLEEVARHYLLHEHISPLNEVLHQSDLRVEMQYHKDIENAFKMGFEFGLKTKKGGRE